VLALVLAVILPVVGPFGSVSVDEGAAAYQALNLERNRGWGFEPPIKSIPEDLLAFPISRSEEVADGWAPYARHPLYALILAGSVRAAGATGMVLVSLIGLITAAVGAARLGARLSGRRAAIASLWLAGAGGPLLFDGYLLIAHTLGAALTVWALLLCSSSLSRRGSSAHAHALGATACLLVGVLLRAEVAIVGLALAFVLVWSGLRARSSRHYAVAALAALAVVAGLLIERAWRGAIGVGTAAVGGPSRGAMDDPVAWLLARGDAVRASVLEAGPGRAGSMLLASVMLLGLGAALSRVGAHRWWILLACGSALLLVAIRSLGSPPDLIPGLLPASPVLFVAAVLGPGRTSLNRDGLLVAGVVVLSFAGIALLQYPEGGAVEWGGRYFAVLLPAASALSVHALLSALHPRELRSLLPPAAAVASSIVLSLLSVATLRTVNVRADGILQEIGERASDTRLQSAPSDRRPVIITTEFAPPRLDWRRYDEHRWVWMGPGVPQGEQDPQILALERDLIQPTVVTLVTRDIERAATLLGPHAKLGPTRAVGGYTLAPVVLD